jgi:hypothetical protein
LKTTQATTAAALLAAAILLQAGALGAQEASPTPAPTPEAVATPAPAPTPTPSPLPILMSGPAHETLRGLAAALQTEAQHALDGTLAAANSGRPTRIFLPGIRMFARRAEWVRQSVDKYRTEPFDVTGTVTTMQQRVGMMSRRMRRNPNLEHTWDDWTAITDILDRMQKVLAGETVSVPTPHTPRPAPTPAAGASPAAPSLAPAGRNPTPMPAVKVPPPSPSPTPTPTPTP